MVVSAAVGQLARSRYVPRGRNQLHEIFARHFDEFCNQYEDRYAKKYGYSSSDASLSIRSRIALQMNRPSAEVVA